MRPTDPPRLVWRKPRPNKQQAGVWAIRDRGREISTGKSEGQRREAEIALAQYIAETRQPAFGVGDPTQVLIGDCLAFYVEDYGSKTRPDGLKAEIESLADFWGDKVVDFVSPQTSAEYMTWRCSQTDKRAKRSKGRSIAPSTAKRELVTLSAALNYCHKNKKLAVPVIVSMPELAVSHVQFLTRSEVARLLLAALGWDFRGKKPVRNTFRINRHLARFILIAYYTATRHDAILKLGWMSSTYGGWFDLEHRILYRRPQVTVETAKRRPPAPIIDRLIPHLKRWRKLTARFVIEYNGSPIRSQERRAFAGAVELAKLNPDITPHWLKHTCITHMLQGGKTCWEVAGYVGTSEAMIRNVYGHHAMDQTRQVANDIFSRRR